MRPCRLKRLNNASLVAPMPAVGSPDCANNGLYTCNGLPGGGTTRGWPIDPGVPYAFTILVTFVPHLGHTPCIAGLPFFMVMCLGFRISTLVLHFMQYPSMPCSFRWWPHRAS